MRWHVLRSLALASLGSLLACGGSAAPGAVAPREGAPTLSPVEEAIAREVDRGNDAALALLEQVVNVNSGTRNLAGVRQVGAVFSAELDRLGFATRWVDGSAYGRAGHLVAHHAGRGPKCILIGHLDTVFEPDVPFQRFEKLAGNLARGPGIIDMKGGDVILLAGLKALAASGQLEGMNLAVVMTGDEEAPGSPLAETRAPLLEAAQGAEVALAFEDGDGKRGHAVIGRRGASTWKLTVRASTAHSSQIFRPDLGYGASFEVARVLDEVRRRLAGEPHLTLNPALVASGSHVEHDASAYRAETSSKNNIIAAEAVVSGDLRTLTLEQLAHARQTMADIAAHPLAGTSSSFSFVDGNPPLAPSDGNRRLLARYDEVSRALGAGPVTSADPDRAGAADVPFLAGRVPMILDGIGLRGDGGHTSMETAELDTLPIQTRRFAVLLHRLTKGSPSPGPGGGR